MTMKRIIPIILAISMLAACDKTPVAFINATVEGAGDSSVVLQKLNYNKLVAVDTIKTDTGGRFNYKVRLTGNEPYFYYLYFGGAPIASMILLPSDRVSINVTEGGSFTVEGSEESKLLKEVNERYAVASDAIKSLMDAIGEDSTESEIAEINRKLSRIYVDYKRSAIRYVMEHPGSITSALVLFQRFGDDLPVFAQQTDAIIFKTIQDSLSMVYPRSEFLTALRDEVSSRSGEMELAGKLGNLGEVSFPDLVMPDVEGGLKTLSDLEGQVFILSFWTVGQSEHKMFNVDLAELYSKYHAQGFEVYQVSLDIDKPTWAATVRNQNLPWINVNDGFGIQSPAVSAYNVDHVPAMFIFDRKGNIVGTDVFDKNLLEQLLRRHLETVLK